MESNRPKIKLLVWGHGSGLVGGGQRDLTDFLHFVAGQRSIEILGAFAVGSQNSTHEKLCSNYVLHNGAQFPICYAAVFNYFAYWIFAVKQILQTRAFIRRHCPDGILFFSSALLMPFVWSLSFRVKRYLFVRELITPPWIRKLVYRTLYKRADLIFTVSDFLKEEIEKLDLGRQIHTIYSLPTIENNLPRTASRNPGEEFRIACIGGISVVKGQLKLIKACHQLAMADRIALHFYGPIQTHRAEYAYFKKIKRFERQCKPRMKLIFHGTVAHEQLMSELQAFDLVAIPSENEGLSIILLEAMLLRLPVVASRIGEIQRIIRHEHNGLLFERSDISDLAQCIERMIQDPVIYNRVKNNLGTLPAYLGTREKNLGILLETIASSMIN